MTITIAKDYNNYYNRIVKFPQEYIDTEFQQKIWYHILSSNFIPGDGVNTNHVVGSYDYDGQGDYLVVTNEQNEIVSRWFIIDHIRTRAGQYQLNLRRDLIADFFDLIVDSPMFIEKASLPYDSPMLFNKEDMTFNQVLKNSYPIKDKSQCAWIVGYYAKNSTDMAGTVLAATDENIITIAKANIESWEFAKYKTTPFAVQPDYYSYSISSTPANIGIPSATRFYINSNTGNISSLYYSEWDDMDGAPGLYNDFMGTGASLKHTLAALKKAVSNIDINNLNQYIPDYATDIASDILKKEFFSYQGKLVQTEDGKIYKISIINNGSISKKYNITPTSNLGMLLNDITFDSNNYNSPEYIFKGTPNNNTFKLQASCESYLVEIQEQIRLEVKYDMTGNVARTEDAPYNIFAIPYGEITIKNLTGDIICETNRDISMRTAQAIQSQQQSKLSDIQLLPYCPLQSMIKETGIMYVDNTQQTGLYSLIKDGEDNAYGIIFNISRGRFSFNITSDLWGNIPPSNTNIGVKINNECKKYRLCSPNYSNFFDFSAEMNYGVNYFNVDCDYKPYTPYIHINPNFGGLYGYDDNSPRGLVLGGDFSITAIGEAWVQYQINNKNFQNIFDRQIQNMEVQHKYQRIQDYANMFSGTMQGATSGAMTGALAGPGGAIAGGIVGGISSLAGGIADVSINEKLRNEALDYTKDMFGYQLGNIQAIPQTISKVSAYNNNNKLFPVLETYECTEKELEAFVYKLAYNGMTTMVIGKLSDYIYRNEWEYNGIESKGYIKGKLIRLEGTGESFNVINAISGELDKGVFIK